MEYFIRNRILKIPHVYILSRTDTGYAYRVRPYAEHSLQMLCVHQKPDKIVAVQLKPVQYAKTDIVNPALHGSVHSLGMVGVIVLRSCRMKLFVIFLIIRLLEQYVRANARIL